jgi:hypothetical protein
MILTIIPILGITICYSAGSLAASTGNTSASSIKETIDEVVTDTLDGMMNDTIDNLIQDTSKSVFRQSSNFNQSKFPSILDMSQSPSQDKSLVINTSEMTFNQNISNTGDEVENITLTANAPSNMNDSSFSNKTQYLSEDTRSDKVDKNKLNYSSSMLIDDNNKSNTADKTKPVNYLADLFDKLMQLLFKRS